MKIRQPDSSDYASSGKSVGNWRVSAVRLAEEAVEFAAGRIEGVLLLFRAVVGDVGRPSA